MHITRVKIMCPPIIHTLYCILIQHSVKSNTNIENDSLDTLLFGNQAGWQVVVWQI